MNRRGTVVIVALWTLSLLAVLAVYLGVSIRAKMTLQKRLEARDQLRILAHAVVRKSIAFLNEEVADHELILTPELKTALHNNRPEFSDINLSSGQGSVFYPDPDKKALNYGLSDEESKIDLNTVSFDVLKSLLLRVLMFKEDDAAQLAGAIVDWREHNPEISTGLFAEQYYAAQPVPYSSKHAPLDIPEELLLVKGMTKEIFEKLEPYVTIYSGGVINVNTASRTVLFSLGFREEFVDQFLRIRRGPDSLEATSDDVVFVDGEMFDQELQKGVQMQGQDHLIISRLNQNKRLAVTSALYRIDAEVSLANSQERKRITCVFDVLNSRIVYHKQY